MKATKSLEMLILPLTQYIIQVKTYSWVKKNRNKLIEQLRHNETFELIESGNIITSQATLK